MSTQMRITAVFKTLQRLSYFNPQDSLLIFGTILMFYLHMC